MKEAMKRLQPCTHFEFLTTSLGMKVGLNPDPMDPVPENPEPVNMIL